MYCVYIQILHTIPSILLYSSHDHCDCNSLTEHSPLEFLTIIQGRRGTVTMDTLPYYVDRTAYCSPGGFQLYSNYCPVGPVFIKSHSEEPY